MCGEKDHDRGYEIGGEKCVPEVVLSLLVCLVGGKRGLSSLIMMVILGKMETILSMKVNLSFRFSYLIIGVKFYFR
jgi:uncharacterized membrane protein